MLLILTDCSSAYVFLVTVLEVIQRSADFLSRKGVDSPRLQAELLLAHVLKMPRMKLYLNFEQVLSAPDQDLLRQLVKRRGDREPLQHILGSTSFCGLEIKVDRRVLIPRPETELLAERGWMFLNRCDGTQVASSKLNFSQSESELKKTQRPPAALDFGTGSGCIAIALAVNCPAARVVALDVDPEALELARENATELGVAERIQFVLGNGLGVFPDDTSFDLVVANPPYIPSGEIDALQPEVRDYDPRRALDGGADGLDFFRQLAGQAGLVLKSGGKLMVEFGDGQSSDVAKLFEAENWIVEDVVKDYTQKPRILIARSPGEGD